MKKAIIDKPVMLISGGICLAFVLWAAILPEMADATFDQINAFLCSEFGWFYLVSVTVFLLFLIWIAFSKYGKIKLGKDNDKPEFSTRSWVFMLFATGMGIGIVFWSVAEPMLHYLTPINADPRTVEAAEDALRMTYMHWGFHPWAVFGIVGLPLAYFQFRKGKPGIISSCLIPLIGEKRATGNLGRAVSIFVIFATIFGIATSLGLGAMQIQSGMSFISGIELGNVALIAIIVVITILFVISAVTGIDKGVQFLSNLNMIMLAALILILFVMGPPSYLINSFVDTTGRYLSQIVSQSFWTDPYNTEPGWLDSWTVFYWAWWISWGPFVGGFVARISKGRTIKEFIIGVLVVPTILCFICITVFGGMALQFDLNGVTSIAEATQADTSVALFALFGELPLGTVFSVFGIILVAIFFITGADSSTIICAMHTSMGSLNPPKKLMIFWGVVESLVAIVLLLFGGLGSLQTACIIGAFPFMIICIFIVISFIKALRSDPAVALIPIGDESEKLGG